MPRISPALLGLVLLAIPLAANAAEVDSDGDGLSDFLEIHKYRTDPEKVDSDGDGIPDGDWHERREFNYSVRTVVKVLRPCNLAAINDDYQDARVLHETDQYVELEVVHYPVNALDAAITGSSDWAAPPEEIRAYLKPGVTSNWDDQLRKDLLEALRKEGFDPASKTDAEVVRHVSQWLLNRGTFQDVFGTYFVEIADGEARIRPGLEQPFREYNGGVNARLPLAEHFQHELFGKGMFYNKCYGTCTSTATYLATGLRAMGIPTRMVLCIPAVDANDDEQLRLIERGLANNQLRQSLLRNLAGAKDFSAHTFNEVYIDGRWRRLNYSRLGANIDSTFGLMTHVHTFTDLSEADLTRTWGWRYGKGERDTIFKTSNPYRATEISDRYGVHCNLANPESKEHRQITIAKAYWHDAADAPGEVKNAYWIAKDRAGHLFVHGDEWFKGEHYAQYKEFMIRADPNFKLVADGAPDITGKLSSGYITAESQNLREIEIRFDPAEFGKMLDDLTYRLVPVNGNEKYRWAVADGVVVKKGKGR
jgi:hypothetical protein